jgi:uncharacterized membrane protein HdeD (DUF308 family)
MAADSSDQPPSANPATNHEFDFTLETVILLVLSVFMLLFGVLLFAIHTGSLPYSPDSTYGLLLVIVALQVITMGKTPFGDVRRSWVVIIIGIAAAVFGMTACFIPGALTSVIHDLVGVILLCGGIALFLQLVMIKERAATWVRTPGVLRNLTLASALVYFIAVLLGLVTLLPTLTTDALTAVLLIVDGIGLFWLAWSVQQIAKIRARDPAKSPAPLPVKEVFFLFREAPIPFTTALLIFLGVLLALLAILLVPVNLGMIPFSPDGQLGLLLVIMSIQVLAMGETPVGQFRRSLPVVVIGLAFVGMGVISCIVPGLLTGTTVVLLAVLNILGGLVPLTLRVLPMLQAMRNPPAQPVAIPPPLKNLLITQTVLNIVGILFGLSMLLPGLIPGMVTVGILFANGLLLFVLARILSSMPAQAG